MLPYKVWLDEIGKQLNRPTKAADKHTIDMFRDATN
jgi:hypothetical protein